MSGAPPTFLTSPRLDVAGVRHAFFTRQGGVSSGIYASLNLGRGSRDDPAAVLENQARAAAALGLEADSLTIAYQVHSTQVHVAERAFGDDRPEGDGAATVTPGVLCGALAADCAPVLMADPAARVVCAVHAGWRGALGGVIEAGVAVMTGLGASPGRIVAAVGPCIGPQSYEVGEDFRQTFLDADPASASRFHATDSYSIAFDLPAYALDRLRRAGVEQAEWIGADTYSDPELFFSNRRALHRREPDFGRLLSAIALV
jgi:YfiH family protein